MFKKLFLVIVVLSYTSLIVFAHGDVNDSFMTTITRSNVLIIGIAAGLSLVYSGIIWTTLAERSSRLFFVTAFVIAFAGFIHLAAGRSGDWILLANGLGYLVFVVMRGHKLIRLTKWNMMLSIVIIIYTIITFIGYFLTHDHYDIIAVSSKTAEVVLIGLLLFEIFQSYRAPSNLSYETVS